MTGTGLEHSPPPCRGLFRRSAASELLVQIVEIGPTNAAPNFGQVKQNIVRHLGFQLIGDVSLQYRTVGTRKLLATPNRTNCVQPSNILASQLNQPLTQFFVLPYRLLNLGRPRRLELFVQKRNQFGVGESVRRRGGIGRQEGDRTCEKMKWASDDRENQTPGYGSVFSKL